jgi:predicted RNA-binding protein with PIN domain
MIYLIDGHNLIPKLKGISLNDIDDEEQLIQRLQAFIKPTKRKLEIYFDGAPHGFGHTIRCGKIVIQFVAKPSSADAAIISRISNLKKDISNFTVVSSDRRILSEANAKGIKTILSENFASTMEEAKAQLFSDDALMEENEDDRDEWLRLFNRGKL